MAGPCRRLPVKDDSGVAADAPGKTHEIAADDSCALRGYSEQQAAERLMWINQALPARS
jgi:hypothetical protein